MRCPACDHDNAPRSRFCEGCGAGLQASCADCGHGLRAGAKFCGRCGAARFPTSLRGAADAGPSGAAERRLLTVMSCDLAGSTALSQRLDAEVLSEILQRYHLTAAAVIDRYGGHVAQYLGDGVLVYFGYPRAREDDAERAVRAGCELPLAISELNRGLEAELGVRLQVRIGIHTGPVVVSEVGRGARRETLAMGATTNIAARLEDVAEPGTVVLSHDTLRLVPGLFVTEDLGTPRLKGVSSALRAHRVLHPSGVRGRLHAAARLTPFVGREQELAGLEARWQLARGGAGQVVLLSGEAGLGKSRLLKAFSGRLAKSRHTWLESGGSALGSRTPFQPITDLVSEGLSFKPGESDAAKLRRVEIGLEQVGLDAPALAPYLASLLALEVETLDSPDLGSELRRTRGLEAIVTWILALAARQPLVMVVEDLHWCDPSTLDVLSLLIRRIGPARVLLVLTARPELAPPWPPAPHVTHLALERLSPSEARRVAAGADPRGELPDAVVERILQRAEGVPLFVEELARMVHEAGPDAAGPADARPADARSDHESGIIEVPQVVIPATLHGSLMARLDRLPSAKPIAQVGAAIGRELPYRLLRTVAEMDEAQLVHGLDLLLAAGLLLRRGTLPDATFVFRHTLIQEAAYHSLLKSVRKQLHGRIAAAYVEGFPDLAAAHPDVLAFHYEQAGAPLEAAAWLARGGERAMRRLASTEAVSLFERGLELLAEVAEGPDRLRAELALQTPLAGALAITRGWASEEVARAARRARQLASDLGRAADEDQALLWLSMHHWLRADLAENVRLLEQRLAEAAGRGADARPGRRTEPSADLDPYVEVSLYLGLGVSRYFRGDFASAHRHFADSLELAATAHDLPPQSHQPHPRTQALIYDALTGSILGDRRAAVERSIEATRLARTLDHPLSLAATVALDAQLHLLWQDFARARELASEAVELACQWGFPFYEGFARFLLGSAHLDTDPAAGLGHCLRAQETLRPMRIKVGAPHSCALMAELCLAAGRPDDAAGALAKGAAAAAATGQRYWDSELRRLEALVAVSSDAPAQDVETLLRLGLETARAQQASLFERRLLSTLDAYLPTHQEKTP